jgi:Nitrile hydratase beta subunit, C-terminal
VINAAFDDLRDAIERIPPADPDGHTRLPRYARGHVGEVAGVRAAWQLPDEAVRGVFRAEPACAVRFAAAEPRGSIALGDPRPLPTKCATAVCPS